MNAKNIQIGIVVPVFSVQEQYLRECIDSLINQTYRNIEIILVDDCSPDNCGMICDEYAKQDSRVHVLHFVSNRGLSEARNEGTKHCQSEWITFVDADDWLDLDTIEKVVPYVSYKTEMVLFHACLNFKNIELRSEFHSREWLTKDRINELQCLALSCTSRRFPQGEFYETPWGKIIKKSFLVDNGLYFKNLSYKEDATLFQEEMELATGVIEVGTGTYHYRMRSGSETNKYRPNAPEENVSIIGYFLNHAKRHNKKEDYYHAIYLTTLFSMRACLTSYFFNKQNKEKYTKKRRECKKYFSQEIYKDVYKNINIRELKKSYQIAYIFFKYGLYGSLSKLIDLGQRIKRMEYFP